MSTAVSPDSPAASGYAPREIEPKWQAAWREARLFATPEAREGRVEAYVFVTPPFTSGEAHMGHVRSYTIGDAHARFRRARDEAVLFSLGFDAFGLPSEQGAIEHDMTPQDWVARCYDRMHAQFDELGLSFDWERAFVSSDPAIYGWSQWLFLKLREAGVIYQRDGQVEWCDACRTVLANLQVEDGRCWRCEGPIRLVRRRQWYVNRSRYNEENDRRLDELDGWNRPALAAQRSVLGRVDGVELDARALDGSALTVFTPFPDAIEQAAFVLLSPNHPDVERWTQDAEVQRRLEEVRGGGGDRDDRRAAVASVVETGALVHVPGIAHPLPVVVSPSVDARFGATASLGIPSVDRTDEAIGEQIAGPPGLAWSSTGKRSAPRPAVRFRAADFAISRQRAWGAPIPLVHCPACGIVPVPADELPVRLPEDLRLDAGRNVLEEHPDFVACPCPACGQAARRESETLDCHIEVAWTELPLAIPPADRAAGVFDHPDLRRWLPVDQLVQGADTGGFILSMRLMAKALRDLDVLDVFPDGEPYRRSLMHEMIQLDGRKMSKHLGNVVAPQELIADVGADAVRFAVLYAAAPTRAFSWNDEALRYSARLLAELWEYAESRLQIAAELPADAQIETSDHLRLKLATWRRTAVEKVTANLEQLDMHQATRNAIVLLTRIRDFERRVAKRRETPTDLDRQATAIALRTLLQLLAPLAPHIAEELWRRAGGEGFVATAPWPAP